MAFLLLVSGIVAVSLVAYVSRLGGRAGIAPMTALFVGLAVWSFAYIFELDGLSLDTRITAAKISYFGIVLIPGSWFVFALAYTGKHRWLSKRLMSTLTVVPIVTLASVWTNEFHGLYWSDIVTHETGTGYWVDFESGPLFWVHSAYSYVLLSLGIGLILQGALMLPGKMRKQGIALAFGTLAPFSGSVFHVFGISPFVTIDPAPIASLMSAGMMIIVVRRLKLLRVLPISREVVMKNFRDGMIVVDENSMVVDINQTAEQIIGLTLDDVILKNVQEIVDYRSESDRFDFTVILGSESESDEAPVLRKNGLNYHPSVTAIDDGSGRIIGRLIVFRDITDRIQIEKREAEARSQFISIISHELRTPLTSIAAFTDVLLRNKQQNLVPRQLKALSSIQRSTGNLNELISDLLDVSKSNGGNLTIDPSEFEVVHAIQEIETSTAKQIKEKDQKFVANLSQSDVFLVADELRFVQIVTNLVTNASKYSPENTTIVLNMEVAEAGVTISVVDQGIGISKEDLARMFTPFFRAANTETRSQTGTGLGLAIVKSLVELHGGTVNIESELGVGTTVSIWIPGLVGPSEREAAA